ncbi:MAG: NAD-dependent epimerase/dehydratase family protein [Opitutaceae bacterium]
MRSKVILAGGSGLLGRAVAQDLVTMGWDVVVLTRKPHQQLAIDPILAARVRLVYWDGAEHGSWAAELEGAAALVNLVGRSINCVFTPKHRHEILHSRLRAVAALGRAVAECSQPPAVWVQASAVGYYGFAGAAHCDEAAPVGTDFLAGVCRQWETAFQAACPAKIRPVILRLGVVLDAEVVQASSDPDLDRRAQEIARKAGPFGAFTAEMRKTVDQLVVVSRFTFTQDATLQTKAMVPP